MDKEQVQKLVNSDWNKISVTVSKDSADSKHIMTYEKGEFVIDGNTYTLKIYENGNVVDYGVLEQLTNWLVG
jgi:hypothetical protein